jgi:hypothetical protein
MTDKREKCGTIDGKDRKNQNREQKAGSLSSDFLLLAIIHSPKSKLTIANVLISNAHADDYVGIFTKTGAKRPTHESIPITAMPEGKNSWVW